MLRSWPVKPESIGPRAVLRVVYHPDCSRAAGACAVGWGMRRATCCAAWLCFAGELYGWPAPARVPSVSELAWCMSIGGHRARMRLCVCVFARTHARSHHAALCAGGVHTEPRRHGGGHTHAPSRRLQVATAAARHTPAHRTSTCIRCTAHASDLVRQPNKSRELRPPQHGARVHACMHS